MTHHSSETPSHANDPDEETVVDDEDLDTEAPAHTGARSPGKGPLCGRGRRLDR